MLYFLGHGSMQQPTHGNSFGMVYQSKTPQPPPGMYLDLPNFHSDLRSQELFEGQNIHLETKLTPLHDPNLEVVWYLNGRELVKSELTIKPLDKLFRRPLSPDTKPRICYT